MSVLDFTFFLIKIKIKVIMKRIKKEAKAIKIKNLKSEFQTRVF